MWWLQLTKKKFSPVEGETSFLDTSGGLPTSNVSEPAEGPTGSDVNWSEIADEFDQGDNEGSGTVEGDLEVVSGDGSEPTPAASGETPQATPPAAAPVATPPATAPAPTPEPAAPTPPAPAAVPTPTPSAPQGEPSPQPNYAEWRAKKEEDLATQTYSINDEDAAKLLTEPETVLPRMAARMHMEVMENAMRAMQVMLPQMMSSVQHATQVETSAKGLFHQTNPDLVDPKLEPAILEMGTVYRRLNPAATPETAAVAIGNLVRASLGIAMPQAAAAPAAAAVPPAVPFVPARGGSGGPIKAGSGDVWGQLANEFLADEA